MARENGRLSLVSGERNTAKASQICSDTRKSPKRRNV